MSGAAAEAAPAPATRPHVAIVLPRGEAIRNFVQSGVVSALAAECRVSLLTVLTDENARTALGAGGVDVLELTVPREAWPLRFTREILDLAHGRWLWSEAARDRWRFRDLEAARAVPWMKRRVKKALALPFANAAGLAALSRIESALAASSRETRRWADVLARVRPDVVFNGSHVHGELAAPAISAAAGLGIPTAAFVFSWDNLTSQGRIMQAYDDYLVWSAGLKRQLLGIYPSVRPERVHVTGTPQFDFHFRPELRWSRAEYCAKVGADPARPIVFYTTGMANHMPGEPVLVERLADRLAGLAERPQLLVRVYAKDRTGRFDELRRRRTDILFMDVRWSARWLTPEPEDSVLYVNALRHADVGINVASTVTLELCVFDRPVVNVAYDPPGVDVAPVSYARYYEFDHYRPVAESGAVHVARSEDELVGAVSEALRDPSARSAARKKLLADLMGPELDGQASRRIRETLLALARGTVPA